MLFLKRPYILLVKSGLKRQTLRYWSHPRVHVGQHAFTPGLGYLLITAVDPIPSLRHLTTADALADGFPNKPTLLKTLRTLYPHPPKTHHLYRIQFQYPAPPKPEPKKKPKTPRAKSKPKTLKANRQTLKNYILSKSPTPR